MTTLLTGAAAWRAITAAIRRNPSRCTVAVAYFGTAGSKLLPLARGSVLVVDASTQAICSGQTNPSELLKLVRRDVAVYSRPGLHAKLFVTRDEVFVGSTNVSTRSAEGLIEATSRTDDPNIRRSARNFIDRLIVGLAPLSPHQLRSLAREYKPPRFAPAKRSRRVRVPTWLIGLRPIDFDEDDRKTSRTEKPIAKAALCDPENHRIDEFLLSGRHGTLSRHHQVITFFDVGRRVIVEPPGVVIRTKRYATRRGARRTMVYVERPKRLRGRRLAEAAQRLGISSKTLRKIGMRRGGARTVRTLIGMWQRAV